MRIIAGRWRGTRLAAVGKGDPGAHLRPTPDRVRESLFSMLTHLGVLDGARVLDLLPERVRLGSKPCRGARLFAAFVENGRIGQGLIRDNIKRLRAEGETLLIRMDVTRLGDLKEAPFDLVFLDPPYGKTLGQSALDAAQNWMVPGAIVVWEENGFMDPPPGFARLDQRRFGEAHVTLMERKRAPA